MSNRYAPREGSRQKNRGIIVSLYPDFCRVGNAICPFIIHAFQDEAANTSATVRMTRNGAHTSGSFITSCHGNEGGTGGGVDSGTQMGVCVPGTWSGTVRIEGRHAVRHSDEWHMNNGNTVGKLNWMEDSGLYGPTPPFTGGPEAEPLTDAADTETPQDTLQAAFPGGQQEPPPPQPGSGWPGGMQAAAAAAGYTMPVPSRMPDVSALLKQAGRAVMTAAARYAPRRGGITDIMLLFERLDRQAARQYEKRLETMKLADRLLAPVRNGDVTVAGFEYSIWSSKAANAERLLTLISGVPMTLSDITADDVDAILSGWNIKPLIDSVLSSNQIADSIRKATVLTAENTRVSSKCREMQICFMPVNIQRIDMKEFCRQLKLQERGLNRLLPFEYVKNRIIYSIDGPSLRLMSKPLQEKTHQQYRTKKTLAFQVTYRKDNWKNALDRHLAGLDALHNPDMIAGGYYHSVADTSLPLEDRMGGRSENRSIGAQWPSRVKLLDLHVAQQINNHCPAIQAKLDVCRSYPGKPGTLMPEQAGVPA